jgi:hypothetical protein
MRYEGRLSPDAVALARWRARGGLGAATVAEHRAALRALGVLQPAANVERDRDECEAVESLAGYFVGCRHRRDRRPS